MKSMNLISWMVAVGFIAAAGIAVSAQAVTIVPVSATASTNFTNYEANFAIDSGPNSALTDWASRSQGANAYINLDLGAVYSLATSFVTDRVTSGGPNGAFFGGTTDFTTQYSLTVYTDASFNTIIGSALVFSKATPGGPSSPVDFLDVRSLGGLTAQYVRYSVLASNGLNSGLADIRFDGTLATTAVPEPAVWGLMVIGFGMVGVTTRRRAKAVAA
jgi:hypothetical protein